MTWLHLQRIVFGVEHFHSSMCWHCQTICFLKNLINIHLVHSKISAWNTHTQMTSIQSYANINLNYVCGSFKKILKLFREDRHPSKGQIHWAECQVCDSVNLTVTFVLLCLYGTEMTAVCHHTFTSTNILMCLPKHRNGQKKQYMTVWSARTWNGVLLFASPSLDYLAINASIILCSLILLGQILH